MSKKGIVYVLSNPAMPEIVKIGKTSGNTLEGHYIVVSEFENLNVNIQKIWSLLDKIASIKAKYTKGQYPVGVTNVVSLPTWVEELTTS